MNKKEFTQAVVWDDTKRKLCITVCNYERCKRFLADKIYKKVLDLAVVPRVFFGINRGYSSIGTMYKEAAARLCVTEDEIIHAAFVNSPRIWPSNVQKMSELFHTPASELVPELNIHEAPEMYAISNTLTLYGAGAILYPGVLENLRTRISSDLYLIPSSIHEFIAVPYDFFGDDTDSLRSMIYATNRNKGVVKEEDVLSDNAYFYNGKLRIV